LTLLCRRSIFQWKKH